MVKKESFGKTQDGEAVDLYTVTNAAGAEARIINYGCVIVSLSVPDREGRWDDVVMGFDILAEYQTGKPYIGAVVGRFGNRIAKGRFTLDGVEYQLAVNRGLNHLHGGTKGFDKRVWRAEPLTAESGSGVSLSYTSPDGEENYPGTLEVNVTYLLTEENELVIGYQATTDKATPLNLTQHTYFNLAGDGKRDVLDHELEIFADHFTPQDETQIPTGEIRSVEGTPLDFRQPTPIGARIGAEDRQMVIGKGYDQNFVLRGEGKGKGPALAARAVEPQTGRVMEVLTTEPALQFFSGNYDTDLKGKKGRVYKPRYGFCLETQHFPDSPNRTEFPSSTLRPGETFRSRTVYKFSARKA